MYYKKGFTTGEVAELCHVTIPTVIKWIESEELEGFKIPGSKNRRITRKNLLKFMKKHKIPTTALEREKPRILVVENDEETLGTFKKVFDKEKYDIRLVTKGFEAGLAKEFKPDVTILGLDLPDMDGQKVCQYLREMPEMRHSAIIGICKNANVPPDILKTGFDDYVAEPFTMEGLIKKARRLLSKIMRRKRG
jgi:excisionase family DNA binding protein